VLAEEDFDDEVAWDLAYIAKFGLYGFMQKAWHVIEPGVEFIPNWHLEEICNHLGLVSYGFIRTLLENIPPGTCKSVITSVLWHPWEWGPAGMPQHQFLFTSYAPSIVNRDAEKAFMLIESEWYRKRWGVRILDRSMTDYRNSAGGRRISRFVNSQGITGEHPHRKVVDDPIKAADTMGAKGITRLQLDWVNKVFWDGTMATRGAGRGAASVITMQRLHEDDLTGYVKGKTSDAVHLRLPMRYEADNPCRTEYGGDRRTEEGELLWPALFPEDKVKTLEADLNVHAAAQLQQRAARAGGQIFNKSWFRYWNDPAEFKDADEWALSWDMTFKDTMGSDFVAGGVWARKGARYYLVDRIYDRMNFPQTVAAFRLQCRQYPQALLKLVEDKANGPAVIAMLQNEIPGIVAVNPMGGKVARANAVAPFHRAGNVYHPNPDMPGYAWVREHETDMCGFPLARHDDTVDQETQMLLHWKQNANTLFDAL
jgi:predicted phage terminase large subunit-like protein